MVKALFEEDKADFSGWTWSDSAEQAFDTANIRPLLKALMLDAFDGDGLGKAHYGKEVMDQIDAFQGALLSGIAETIDSEIRAETDVRLELVDDNDGEPSIVVGFPLCATGALHCAVSFANLVDEFLDPYSIESAATCSKLATAFRGFADKLEAAAAEMRERTRDA